MTHSFLKHARTEAASIGLAAGAENVVANILINALGQEWISNQVRRLGTRLHPFPASWKHPFAECWTDARHSGVCGVVELASYLNGLAYVDGLESVLPILKSDYMTATLQLAHAYRLRRAGASCIRLEPSAAAGRQADIFAAFGAKSLMIECYAPQRRADPTGTEDLWLARDDILELFKGRHVCVEIRPKVRLESSSRKQILREVKELSGKSVPSSLETELASYTVTEAEENNEGVHEEVDIRKSNSGVAWVIQASTTSAENIEKLGRGEPFERRRGTMLAVYPAPVPQPSAEKQARQLAKKIAKKATQARSTGTCERMVIVRTDLATRDDSLSCEFTRTLLEGIDQHLKNPCHVFLVNRKWSPDNRWHWYGQLRTFKAAETPPWIGDLVSRLRDDELQRDLFFDEGLGVVNWPQLGSLPHYAQG